MSLSLPPYLNSGDKIYLTAPAGSFRASLEGITNKLKSWGLVPVLGKSIKSDKYLAATDANRLNDFNAAINDQEIKAILCLRGGYGITRILDKLEITGLKSNPKWIIGFSDITALHLILFKNNIASVHGPMASHITDPKSESGESLKKFLFEGLLNITTESNEHNSTGSVEGKITGGNLSLICDSIGTPNEIQTENRVLLIEEIGEPLYKIDRMLTQLKRTGKLEKIKGLIVGQFTDLTPMTHDMGYTLEEILLSKVQSKIPIAFNFPSGHTLPNYCIPMGMKVYFEVNEQKEGKLLNSAS